MKHIIALVIVFFTVVVASLGVGCFYAIVENSFCIPSIMASPTNSPPCYQQYGAPLNPYYCDEEDDPPPHLLGGTNCTTTNVPVVLESRVTTLYQPGEGPNSNSTVPYCYNNDTQFTPTPTTNTCSQAILGGTCRQTEW